MSVHTEAEPRLEAAVNAAIASSERPPRPSAFANALTFGWRAVLKIKHVPEQLFDVTAFPIIMVLLFTYLCGGVLAPTVGPVVARLDPVTAISFALAEQGD